jgi:predicted DNA-binding transcriptional regulator AlpA
MFGANHMSKFEKLPEDLDLDPNQIVRLSQGPKYFGYKHTQQDEKIKDGTLPPPFPLSENGRARGWLGRQIIEHHRRRLAAAAKQRRRAEGDHAS